MTLLRAAWGSEVGPTQSAYFPTHCLHCRLGWQLGDICMKYIIHIVTYNSYYHCNPPPNLAEKKDSNHFGLLWCAQDVHAGLYPGMRLAVASTADTPLAVKIGRSALRLLEVNIEGRAPRRREDTCAPRALTCVRCAVPL